MFSKIKKLIPYYIKVSFYILIIHAFGDNASLYIALAHLKEKLKIDFYSLKTNK